MSRMQVRTMFTLGLAGAAAVLLTAPTAAQEQTVQNDRFISGGPVVIVGNFVPGEHAGVRLTSPCEGAIVAVQIGWLESTPGHPQSIEEAIHIYDGSTFPAPGSELEVLLAPVLTPGFLNEYRFLDKDMLFPLNVPVTLGQQFYVTLEFDNATNVGGGGPSVIRDVNGCQGGKNTLFAIPGGWLDFCIFLAGDLVIRAVIDCGPVEPTEACCFATSCLDLTVAACATAGGVAQGFGTVCAPGDVCPIGACCLGDGSCSDGFTEPDCIAQGGIYQNHGSLCSMGVNCPAPVGACCFATGGCLVLDESDCTIANGSWAGLLTDCSDNNGNGDPDVCEVTCPTDVNGDGVTNVLDLIDLLLCFGQPATPPCDTGQDVNGDGSVNVLDLIDLLLEFGQGCA